MENKIKKFIFANWHWFAFLGLTLLSLSFLIFQRGIWAFTDSGFFYRNTLQTERIAFSKLGQFATTDGFYFGYDNSASNFSHLFVDFYQLILVSIFGSDLGQIIYYLIYYLACFYFGLKLLKKLFPYFGKLEIRLGALFLAFNPFSLLISTLYITSYIYPVWLAFSYYWLKYLASGRINYLALSCLSGIFLLSYLRLIPIVVIGSFFILFIINDKKYFNFKRLLIFLVIFSFLASPFIVNNFLSIKSSGNIVINYQEAFARYEKANYDFKQSFINSFSYPGGFTPSALSYFYNQRGLPGFNDDYAVSNSFEFYKIIQIIFNLSLLIFSIWLLRTRRDLKTILLVLVVLLINTIGFFLSLDTFNLLHRTILTFLYNDYGFIQFIQVFLLTFLLVSLVHYLSNEPTKKKYVKPAIILVLFYLLINVLPLFSNYYGLKKIEQIPANYERVFNYHQDYETAEATVFVPYYWLNFDWSNYYLNLNLFFYSPYQTLFVPNLRVVNYDLTTFYNNIFEHFDDPNLSNLKIFNIKNLFVFHDVVTADKNQDSYQVKNIESTARQANEELVKSKDLKIVESQENFTHYRFRQADDYEFFIYSPKVLINSTLDKFYNQTIDFNAKPVLVNKSELNRVNLIDEIDFRLNSPYISYKVARDNPNKYYLKLKVNKDYPFIVQFNQTFSPSWTVYFVDQKEWESAPCRGTWDNYVLSENRRCTISGQSFDFRDLKFLTKKSLLPENHFQSNIVGNGFLFTPDDIPAEFKTGDDLYLVIYFKKQLPYIITLSVFFLASLALIVIGFLSWLLQIKKKYVIK